MNRAFLFILSIFCLAHMSAQPDFVLTNTLCAGNSVVVSLNSGTTAVSGCQWSSLSPGPLILTASSSLTHITFPSAGTFTIMLAATSGNLTYYSFHSITIHPLPNITLSASSYSICVGQSSTLTAAGATNYVWTPTLNMVSLANSSVYVLPNLTTTYSVVGTNTFGCSGTNSIIVDAQNYPSLLVSASADSICQGFTSTVSASGAFSYTWTGSTLANPVLQSTIAVGPGTYSLLGANGICMDSASIVIKTAPSLTLNLNSDRTMICTDGDDPNKPVNFSASGATYYLWEPYVPGRMTYSLGAFTSVSPTLSTCYTLTGSSSICSATTAICINVSTCTEIEENERTGSFSVFPNPVQNELSIRLASEEEFTLSIINVSGALMYKEEVKSKMLMHQVSIIDFPAGIYFVKLDGLRGSSQVARIIKM